MEKMAKYDMFQRVTLTDGSTANIIEVFDDGETYEVDVWHLDEYNPYEQRIIGAEDIKEPAA